MAGVRELRGAPRILPLYARTAAALVPGARLLPLVPGAGSDVPDTVLALDERSADAEHVARYARVCGFALRDALPPTYPHVLAFPLHLALMADGRFPFGAMGLVHVANRIVCRRPIGLGEPLALRVHATPLEPHPKGRTFTIVSEALAGGEVVWQGESTMLRRGGGEEGGAEREPDPPRPERGTRWRLPGDLGRRYAAASGDRNPIHLHPLTARPLGFPRAIAHGMWTKARCVAALHPRLPDAFAVEVAFRKPILLPGEVAFGTREEGDATAFAVWDPARDSAHVIGRTDPAAPGRR
jgi:acyl dehydratase